MLPAFRALRAAPLALLALLLPSYARADTVVVDDTFADGNKTGQTPPSSVNWFVNTGATIPTTTAVGSLTLNNTASRLLVGYFTASPLTVSSGQTLSLQISFRSDVTPAALTNGFNLALFNSAGSRVAADFSGTSNAAFSAYDGYGVKTSGLGSTSGSAITLRQRNLGTSTAPMSTSGDWATLATGSGTMTAASANVNYVATLNVTNNGATVSLNYSLKTADGVTTLQTLSGTDSASLVTAFDTVALYAQTASFPSGNLIISRIQVTVLGDAAVQAPSVTGQPQNQTVNVGDGASFSVTATGTAPLTYQWYKGIQPIDGATSATLSLSNVQVGDAGNYHVVVTNAAGSAPSNDATLTVNAVLVGPSITQQPTNQVGTVGGSATFTVVATGSAPLSYAWQKGVTPIPGATSASLTLSSLQLSDAGNYSVIVSNSVNSLPSDTATLTVNLVAPSITKQPSSQSVSIGGSTTLSVTATGSPPLSYQWYKGVAPIDGATSASLTFNSAQPSDAGDYSVVVTNPAGSVPSNTATLSVAANPGGALSRFNLTGFATQGSGTTGGGVIPESDPAYVKVTNALELANAVVAAGKVAGSVKVIEIMNDLDLGWTEIGSTVQSLASSPFRAHATPKLHPVLLVTGMSLLDIKPKSGLTIFSANGATIRHCNFNIKSASNIIIRNLKFDENWEWDEATKGNYDSNDWDFITLSNGGAATNIWIDHCTFTKAYDGILDQKAGTQYVTLSWCKYVGDDGATNPNSWVRQQIAVLEANRPAYPFYNFLRTNGFSVEDIVQIIQGHDKTHLMGSNSLDSQNNTLSATFHHLWFNSMWDRCVPRLRGGNVHDYNIYVDDTNVLAAKRLRDQRAAALSTSLRNTLNNTYSFNPPINGSISTEGGSVLVERSIYQDCLWPLRNNQTDPSNPVYTGKIQALDTIYIFHNTDGSVVNVRGNSTDAGNPMGPFQATIIPFSWSLPDNQLPYSYSTDDPAQLPGLLAEGAGAGRLGWAKQNWLKTAYVDEVVAPEITVGPQSISATVGDTVTFTVTATGSNPLSYQWNKGIAPIDGATSPTLTLNAITAAAAGAYNVTVTNSAGHATSLDATLTVAKAVATVGLSGLSPTYDGSPKSVSATTIPAGLTVNLTYDGSATAPTPAGNYTVVGTIVDANYTGSATGTLSIAKAPATVTLSSLAQVYDGTPKSASASTAPADLSVALTYDGSATAPTAAGNYAVVGTIIDPNYTASSSDTLVIAKAIASVQLGNLSQTYDGSPKSVSASTSPSGLYLILNYAGSAIPPTNAGNYNVSATVSDLNYAGFASGTLVIGKATATLRLSPLKKAYTGEPIVVNATTNPAGLPVDVTYDGGSSAPIYPGSHTLVATVNDVNYSGSKSDTLVITTTALVRHAPTVNGMVDGSVQLVTAESLSLNGTSSISSDLLVPGTPTLVVNGSAAIVGTIDGPGDSSPSSATVTLNHNAVLRYLVRRVDGVALPTVAAPPAPTGTRDVAISRASNGISSFTTLRNLTLSAAGYTLVLPPGTYGAVTASSTSTLVLGTVGATEPSVYNLQSLTLNGSSTVQVVGPIIVTVANGATINATMGNANHPNWLTLNVAAGGVSLSNGSALRGIVVAPTSAITLNGNAVILGEIVADQLTLGSNALLDEPLE